MTLPSCRETARRPEPLDIGKNTDSSFDIINNSLYPPASLDGYLYACMPELDAPAMCNIETRRIIYNFARWPKYLHKYRFFSPSFDDDADVDGLGRFIALIDLHEL